VAGIIACPRCSSQLRVADDEGHELTCPRCLAAVPAPAAAVTASAPPAAPEGSRRAEAGECPFCSAAVEPGWSHCPRCRGPLRRSGRGPRRGGLDRDIRRDNRGIGVGMILLAVLGGYGLAQTLLGILMLWFGGGQPGASVIGLLLLLAMLAAVFAFFYLRRPEATRSAGGAIVRVLAVAGGVTVGLYALTLAFVILLFVVCVATGGKF